MDIITDVFTVYDIINGKRVVDTIKPLTIFYFQVIPTEGEKTNPGEYVAYSRVEVM